MNFAELYENDDDILSDIIAAFPGSNPIHSKEPIKKSAPAPIRTSTRRDPVVIKGKPTEGFAVWLRSKEQVREALQDRLGTPKASVENCIKLYTEHNIKIDDYVTIEFPTEQVYPFREYDREMNDGWTGKMTQDEYTALVKDVQENGIKEPGVLDIINNKDGTYEVRLGEGNHRLKIAMELGIKAYPLRFYYMFG